MPVDEVRLAIDVFQLVLTCAVGAYAFVVTRQAATRKRLDELRKDHGDRLNTHADRLTKIEADIPHLPTNAAIVALTERIGELGGEVKALHAVVAGMKDMRRIMEGQIERMDSWLRNNGG